MYKSILFAILILFTSTVSHAELLCAKKKVKPLKNGSVPFAKSIQATTDGVCPKGFSPIFDSTAIVGATGQAGPQGPKGDPGVLNIHQCRFVVETSVIPGGSNFGEVSAPCSQNEFLLTHAGSASDINVDIVSTVFTGFSNETFASGVLYFFGRNNVGSLVNVGISASAICCPR